MNNIPTIFIVIWLILVTAKLSKLNKVEDYTEILKLKKFTFFGLRVFYQLKLINTSLLVFYVVFGFTELDLIYFILHLLLFILATMKINTTTTLKM